MNQVNIENWRPEKLCSRCRNVKPASEFRIRKRPAGRNRDAGPAPPSPRPVFKFYLTSHCKECQSIADKLRLSDPERRERKEAARRKWIRTPAAKARCRQRDKKRYANPERRKKINVAVRAYLDRNPEKRRAWRAVRKAEEDGLLPKAKNCKCACGNEAIHWHHPRGYSKERWLDVVAVCRDCHENAHHAADEASLVA